MSHLPEHFQADPSMRETPINALRPPRNRSVTPPTEMFDSLVLLAAGSWESVDIRRGQNAVTALLQEMHASRKGRIRKLASATSTRRRCRRCIPAISYSSVMRMSARLLASYQRCRALTKRQPQGSWYQSLTMSSAVFFRIRREFRMSILSELPA
jgi:hypothetical protein